MEGPPHRLWMCNWLLPKRGGIRQEFLNGVETFINHARSLYDYQQDGTIICPCIKCRRHRKLLLLVDVRLHLYKWGFKENYWY